MPGREPGCPGERELQPQKGSGVSSGREGWWVAGVGDMQVLSLASTVLGGHFPAAAKTRETAESGGLCGC